MLQRSVKPKVQAGCGNRITRQAPNPPLRGLIEP